ncbi:hypothetical protein TXYLGN1_05590 [Tepidimicrobium xylanilyticum]
MDRTLWYTINYQELKRLCKNKSIRSYGNNDDCQNDHKDDSKKDSPIPENTTGITSEICNKSVSPLEAREEGQTENKQTFKEYYENIIKKCKLHAIDSKYREGVRYAIKLILVNIEDSKYIRIKDHNIPVEIV